MVDIDSFMKRSKVLYQFGNGLGAYFIFPRTNLEISTESSLKTNFENNRLTDGLINMSIDQKFRKGAYIYDVTFLVDNKSLIDIDNIKSTFWNGYKQIAFFYDLDINSNLTFYYNILTVTKSLVESYKSNEGLGQSVIAYSIELTAETPFLFACDSSLAYFDKSAYVANVKTWDSGDSWDSGDKWDSGLNIASIPISGLTLDQKLELFYSCKHTDNALIYTDRFFNPQSYSLSSDLIVDETLTVNTPVDIQTTTTLADTTADNKIYLIELSTLGLNDTVTIVNGSNSSGIQFRWISSVNSPSLIYYNSLKNRCFTAGNVEIPTSDIQISQVLNSFLYFSSQKTLNSILTNYKENIRLTKNSTSNIDVKIETLKTYH
jgi:hypothetical protein